MTWFDTVWHDMVDMIDMTSLNQLDIILENSTERF